MSQEPAASKAPEPEKSPASLSPDHPLKPHVEHHPVVKMPAPKPTAPAKAVRVPPVRIGESRGFPWGRLTEALVFVLLAAGAGYYVAEQLFMGEERIVDKPVGPVAALLSPGAGTTLPAIDSGAPAVGR